MSPVELFLHLRVYTLAAANNYYIDDEEDLEIRCKVSWFHDLTGRLPCMANFARMMRNEAVLVGRPDPAPAPGRYVAG